MPQSLRLDDARAQLVFLAAIDGKNGANGRFSPTNLNLLLNRKYRALRSRVSQLGTPQFIQSTTAAAIPTQTAGEDFVDLPIPAAIGEVVGVDVTNQGGFPALGLRWQKLDAIEFGQRRDIPFMVPTHGVGFWAVRQAPVPSGATITAGKIAIWGSPNAYSQSTVLAGQYVIHSVDTWADITTDSNVFMIYEAWDEWFLNAAAMTCCQRDKDKSDLYAQAKEAWQVADALIVESAARLQRGGFTVPTGYLGGTL
jgi:hypothetical protein